MCNRFKRETQSGLWSCNVLNAYAILNPLPLLSTSIQLDELDLLSNLSGSALYSLITDATPSQLTIAANLVLCFSEASLTFL